MFRVSKLQQVQMKFIRKPVAQNSP